MVFYGTPTLYKMKYITKMSVLYEPMKMPVICWVYMLPRLKPIRKLKSSFKEFS